MRTAAFGDFFRVALTRAPNSPANETNKNVNPATFNVFKVGQQQQQIVSSLKQTFSFRNRSISFAFDAVQLANRQPISRLCKTRQFNKLALAGIEVSGS